jgi:DNA-binding GntR family transcriptional regulator
MARTPSSAAETASRRTRRATTDDIVRRVTAAITEHRLRPGTKLGEESLGEVFGVSRTKVREALFQLAKLKLVTMLPARGAFVAQPTVREAREVFGARRILERSAPISPPSAKRSWQRRAGPDRGCWASSTC